MKRKFLCFILILSLIFCAACAAGETTVNDSTPQVTESPEPTAEPTVEPTAEPAVVELPPYSVEEDFEVAAIWRAEGFGDDGAAILQTSQIVDGQFSFTVRGYNFISDDDFCSYKNLLLISFSGKAQETDNGYSFSLDKNEFGATGLSLVLECGGTLQLSEDSLMLCYEKAEFLITSVDANNELIIDDEGAKIAYSGYGWSYELFLPTEFSLVPVDEWGYVWYDWSYELFLPTEFSLVPVDEWGYVWYDMPLFSEEINMPISVLTSEAEIKGIFGEPTEFFRDEEFSDSSDHVVYTYETDCGIVRISCEEWTDLEGNIRTAILSYDSSDPSYIPYVRGIELGSHIRDVIARFMNTAGSYEQIIDGLPYDPHNPGKIFFGSTEDLSHQEVYIYGTSNYSLRIVFEDNTPVRVCISGAGVVFYIDESGCVASILREWYR